MTRGCLFMKGCQQKTPHRILSNPDPWRTVLSMSRKPEVWRDVLCPLLLIIERIRDNYIFLQTPPPQFSVGENHCQEHPAGWIIKFFFLGTSGVRQVSLSILPSCVRGCKPESGTESTCFWLTSRRLIHVISKCFWFWQTWLMPADTKGWDNFQRARRRRLISAKRTGGTHTGTDY